IANPDSHPGAAVFNARRRRALVLLPTARLLVPASHSEILRGTPRWNRPPPDDRRGSLSAHASRQKPVRHQEFRDLATQRCSRAKLRKQNAPNPSESHRSPVPCLPSRSLARRLVTRLPSRLLAKTFGVALAKAVPFNNPWRASSAIGRIRRGERFNDSP